jgi:hypothetical protein
MLATTDHVLFAGKYTSTAAVIAAGEDSVT